MSTRYKLYYTYKTLKTHYSMLRIQYILNFYHFYTAICFDHFYIYALSDIDVLLTAEFFLGHF